MTSQKTSLLYELSFAGSERKHYLFGTMHLTSEQGTNIFQVVKPYLRLCSVFVAETNLSGSFPSFKDAWKKDLRECLGGRFYDRQEDFIRRKLNFNLAALRFNHPLHVMSHISQELVSADMGLPIDFLLQNEAIRLGMHTDGLETLDEQYEILLNLPEKQSILQLKKFLKNISSSARQLSRLEALYAQGNIQKMYKLTRRGLGSHRKIHINFRNDRLSERVMNYLSSNQESHFICCGAAHFAGEFGMLRQLKKKGVKVKAVSLKIDPFDAASITEVHNI